MKFIGPANPIMRKWLKITILVGLTIIASILIYWGLFLATGSIWAIVITIPLIIIITSSTYILLHPTTLDISRKKMIILTITWLTLQIGQGFLIHNGLQVFKQNYSTFWTFILIFITIFTFFKILNPSKIKESLTNLPTPNPKHILFALLLPLLLISAVIDHQGLFSNVGPTKASIFTPILIATLTITTIFMSKMKKLGTKINIVVITLFTASIILVTKYAYHGLINMWAPRSLNSSWATFWTTLLIGPILIIIIKITKIKVKIIQEE